MHSVALSLSLSLARRVRLYISLARARVERKYARTYIRKHSQALSLDVVDVRSSKAK